MDKKEEEDEKDEEEGITEWKKKLKKSFITGCMASLTVRVNFSERFFCKSSISLA